MAELLQRRKPPDASKSKENEVQVNPIASPNRNSRATNSTASTSNESTDVPPPPPRDNDIITQTDKDGNSLSGLASQVAKAEESSRNPRRISCIKQLFCCFRNKRTQKIKQRSHTQQMLATPPSGRRSISGHTKLLKPISPEHFGRKCLALDLDETLVHSSFQPVQNADFVIPVLIDDVFHHVYVLKRPGVDEFMKRMGKIYEIVVYTASLSKYADPLLDKLDIHNVITARLFREHCVYFQGHYVKDMSLLNRPIHECIIVDNSPMSYAFHPENAIPCGTYIDSPHDKEMWQLADFLESISKVSDVRGKTRNWRQWCEKNSRSVPK